MSLYSDLNEVLTPYAQSIKGKADKSTTYTKTEVDALISDAEKESLTSVPMESLNFIVKEDVERLTLDNAVSGHIDGNTGEIIPPATQYEVYNNYWVTDYILLEGGKMYRVNREAHLYDLNYNYLGRARDIINAVSDVYVRLFFHKRYTSATYIREVKHITRENKYEYNGFTSDFVKFAEQTGIKSVVRTSDYVVNGTNLFDPDKASWGFHTTIDDMGVLAQEGNAANGVMAIADYYELGEGECLITNYPIFRGALYDENFSFVGGPLSNEWCDTYRIINPIGSGASYVRLAYKYTETAIDSRIHTEADVRKIIIEKGSNKYQYPGNAAFSGNIARSLIKKDYIESAIYTDEMHSLIKCEAIRAMNRSRHAFRIGQLNQYVQRGQSNWPKIAELLLNYGIDICGFEEAQYKSGNVKMSLGDSLRSWQFEYSPDFYPTGEATSPYSNRDAVSAFPIVKSEEIPWTVAAGNYDNRSFLFCKIELPRYLDCIGGLQYLGFYVAHISIATWTIQNTELLEMINHSKTNGCAFNIMTLDSNAFTINPETGRQYLFEFAEDNGFKLCIPEYTNSVTDTNYNHQGEIDQILVSSNIDVVGYDVIKLNGEWALDENTPLSDHDFAFADVVLKYDDLIVPQLPFTSVAVYQNLIGCTSSLIPDYDTPDGFMKHPIGENIVAVITPEEGKIITSVTVFAAHKNITETSYDETTKTITITPTQYNKADIRITATAE